MDRLINVLDDNGVKLVFMDLKDSGYYNPELNMMFINQNLSERQQKEIILHELAHALEHKEFSILYNQPTFRLKMENEATYYMMEKIIEEYDGHYNYSDLFHRYKLGLGWEDKIK